MQVPRFKRLATGESKVRDAQRNQGPVCRFPEPACSKGNRSRRANPEPEPEPAAESEEAAATDETTKAAEPEAAEEIAAALTAAEPKAEIVDVVTTVAARGGAHTAAADDAALDVVGDDGRRGVAIRADAGTPPTGLPLVP